MGEARDAARLVVRDEQKRIVLLRYCHEARYFWATPGGGVLAGESFRDAAIREAQEELGIRAAAPELLWEQPNAFTWEGAVIEQREAYFLIDHAQVQVDDDVLREHEREGILAWRFFSIAEMRQSIEPILPRGLVERLAVALGADPRN
jgi:8-oxo-dGTP pyrophosphatase MutT (NUDIX family)